MLNSRTILCTGGTGSLGHALVRKISAEYKPKKLIVFSRDEYKQSEMRKKFPDPDYNYLRFFIGDVRDKERLLRALDGVDYVIHAAALKQIPALEYNPGEAIRTNITGSVNVVDACIEAGVQRAILVSTDKACNPVNIYGATKLAAEKYFIHANIYNKTKFSAVRYGNVIGSRGSVIPFFLKLKEAGEKVFPVTDLAMTRFWITLDEAVDLVLYALQFADKEVIVPHIPSMKITEIAEAIKPDVVCSFRGKRPGEKLHETLISRDEQNIVLLKKDKTLVHNIGEYTSDKNDLWMSAEELRGKIGLSEPPNQ